MTELWYKAVDARTPLTQGDLILNCPIVRWRAGVQFTEGAESEQLKGAQEVGVLDVIVLTQACDLENSKVSAVILCPAYPLSQHRADWEELRTQREEKITTKAWQSHCDDLKDGYIWNLAMLNEGSGGELRTEHRVVDFHEIYSTPRNFLESWLRAQGHARLQLLPPYREHVSQAFARYFMRVGLPTPVTRPWHNAPPTPPPAH